MECSYILDGGSLNNFSVHTFFSVATTPQFMVFDKNEIIAILRTTPERMEVLIKHLPHEMIHHKPNPEEFSIFDVIGHFIHGEKTDWIPRMKLILERGNSEFEPFDRFAQFKNSEGKSIDQLLVEFSKLRKENIKVLQMTDLFLERTGIHPSLGQVNLEQLLNTWVVHDLSHINQINRILASQFDRVGPWREYLRILNT